MNVTMRNLLTGVTIGLAGMSAGCMNIKEGSLEPGTSSGGTVHPETSSAISSKRIAESNEKIAGELHRIADSLEKLTLPPRPERAQH